MTEKLVDRIVLSGVVSAPVFGLFEYLLGKNIICLALYVLSVACWTHYVITRLVKELDVV